MKLEDVLAPGFRLIDRGRTHGRAAILDEARRLEPVIARLAPPGSVVEVPAGDPVRLLAGLGAAWSVGRAPLPLLAARDFAPADLPATDCELVLRTSGSMGSPRFPEFPAGTVRRSAERIARYLGIDDEDRVGVLQPLEHGFGLVGQLLAAGVAGATAIWAGLPFADERAAALRDGRATLFSAVSFVLLQLLEVGLDDSGGCVRSVGSAGGPLPRSTAARLEATFPRATIWNQYGCTEAGPRLTACPSTSAAFAQGSTGRAIEGVRLTIAEGGAIAFATDVAMRGYLGDEAATAAARCAGGWLTGDIGRLDRDGNLFVLGRTDDVVKIRGLKVALPVVADAALGCGARAALAVPVPGPALEGNEGEIELWVIYEGDADLRLAALRDRLPPESIPARLLRVAALPRLPSGKIDRQAGARLARSRA